MDGSSLALPEALWGEFGSHKGSRGDGGVSLSMVLLYDLFMRVPVAFRLGRSDASERSQARRLFKYLKPASLLLIDSGFYSIEIFAILWRRGARFVCPMRSNGRGRFVKSLGDNDALHEIRRSAAFKNRPDVPATMLLRIVTVHRPGFKARRLVTNLLDPLRYPAAEIAALYHERWHIETFFREFKHTLEAQCFHARTKKALYIELTFQMLLCVLASLAMAQAAQQSGLERGDLSLAKTLNHIKNILRITATLPIKQWPRMYEKLIKEISTLKIDKRPGRSFERDRQKRRQQSRAARPPKLKERQGDAA